MDNVERVNSILFATIGSTVGSEGIVIWLARMVVQQGNIWETREGPNRPPPPIRMGIDYLVYANVIENHNFWQFLPISVNLRLPNRAETVNRHIYTPRPFIWDYNQVSQTSSSYFLTAVLSILANFANFQWPKSAESVQRHIATRHDLLFESITNSLWHSIQRF